MNKQEKNLQEKSENVTQRKERKTTKDRKTQESTRKVQNEKSINSEKMVNLEERRRIPRNI